MRPSSRKTWILALVGYLMLIAAIDAGAYLRLLPTRIASVPFYDTIMHFLLLGMAGWLTHRALGRRSLGRIPLGPAIVALLATTDESLQLFSSVRSFSLGDLAANLAGIVFFWALDTWALSRRRIAAAPPQEC